MNQKFHLLECINCWNVFSRNVFLLADAETFSWALKSYFCYSSWTHGFTEANTKLCLLWPPQSLEGQEINKGRGDSTPALLFIVPKAPGMRGIANSANQAVYLFCVHEEQLCLRTVLSQKKGVKLRSPSEGYLAYSVGTRQRRGLTRWPCPATNALRCVCVLFKNAPFHFFLSPSLLCLIEMLG